MVMYQQGMGALVKYDEFLNFVKSLASSSYYQGFKAPSPLTAGTNLVQPDQYTFDECVAWVATDEGAKFVEEN